MSLAKYKQKRDFKSTPEPVAGKSKTPGQLAFVVQRHKASHLHYDFRLEMGGVLKSWAVPKGPSLNPKDKRLAMMVEDHPFDYKDFSGIIPSGYGAGIVEIWDKGTYHGVNDKGEQVDEKKMRAALKAGNLKVSLKGKKLKGEFALVQLKNSEKDNNWLLIKHRDDFAVDDEYDSEKETAKNSPINKWLSENKDFKKPIKKTRSSKKGADEGAKVLSKDVPAGKPVAKRYSKGTGKAAGKQIKKSDSKSAAGKKATSIEDGAKKIGSASVMLTNTSKIYWPGEGITKGQLIAYYQDIAEYILPFLKDRPQSLKRNPNGIGNSGFFHKDAGEEAPAFVKSFEVYSESSNKTIDYILCNNAATLAYMNNLGCIEINPWHSTIRKPDNPDYLIIDIDPSDKNTFDQVIDTANQFKEVLDAVGVPGYCKTSGASGLHIYVPMGKKYDYDQTKDFALLLCMIVSEQLPEFTTLERNLKKRGDKRIYLDALQNRRSQTISSVYSVRPKPGATVSMPLQWSEVKKGLTPMDFTIHNAVKRIQKQPNMFREVLGPGANLANALKKIQATYGEYLPRP